MVTYSGRRRHHRVAKRAAEHSHKKVYHVPKKNKNLMIVGAIIFTLLVFVKGLVIGLLIARD